MQISVDCNTQGVELYHLSILFQSLAKARGFAVPVDPMNVTSVTIDPTPEQVEKLSEMFKGGVQNCGLQVIDTNGTVTPFVEPPVTYSVESTPINTDHASIDDAGNVTVVMEPIAPPVITNSQLAAAVTNDNLDSAGLPWDARIHAGSRERNTDGSWRVRRRPKGVEEAEWEATLARVTAELRDLMEIPVSTGAVADAAAEEREIGDVHHTAHALTDAEVDAFVDIVQGVTVEIDQHGELVSAETVFVAPPANAVTPPVTIAPPVVVPPVTAVAPPITTDAPKVETFAQVMTFLTARTPKDEAAKPAMVAKVNEILAANGLTVLTQLGQRPELIPQVMTQFTEAFGE